MLTLETLVHKLRKTLRTSYQSISEAMIAGGAKDMEQYKYLLGQAQAYKSIDNYLTEALKTPEEKDDDKPNDENVIRFGNRSTED